MAFEWAKGVGGPLKDLADASAVDAEGNVYVTGHFEDTVDFDPGPDVHKMVSRDRDDIFVLKLNAAGEFVWAKQFGGKGSSLLSEIGNSIAVDPTGGVLVGGQFQDTMNFDSGSGVPSLIAIGNVDAFILRLDMDGNVKWAHRFGGSSADNVTEITCDNLGNVYATGTFRGPVDFNPDTAQFVLTASSVDVFALKLDKEGKFQWANQMNTTGIIKFGFSIITDAAGSVYIGGQRSSSGAGTAGYIWKLDKAGNDLWEYKVDGASTDHVNSINYDPGGYIYASGGFSGPVDFDNGTGQTLLTSKGKLDIFVLKIDTGANFIWAKAIGGDENERGNSIARDYSGNVYVTGGFEGSVDFDPGSQQATLNAKGVSDAFLLKLNSEGQYQWAYNMGGGNSTTVGNSISIDSHGALYACGYYWYEPIDFDPGPGAERPPAMGSQDAFILKWVCNDTTTGTFVDSACIDYTLLGETFTESGTYTLRTPNAAGCDSIITLYLTIPVLEPVINVNGLVLGTAEDYSSYQWFLNGIIIPGATGANYTVKENGDYTVEVTNEMGCEGVSSVYKVTNVPVGIHAPALLSEQIKVYPNPASEQITIANPTDARFLDVAVINVLGQIIQSLPVQPVPIQQIDIRQLPVGYYLLRLQTDQGVVVRPLEVL